jgi:hypothetical protein
VCAISASYEQPCSSMPAPKQWNIRTSDSQCADNAYYEMQGQRHIATARNIPARIPIGSNDGSLWICAQADVTDEFLDTFHLPPYVVTCKPRFVPRINEMCRRRNVRNSLFNIGYSDGRWATFMACYTMSVNMLVAGHDTILHCRAGVHRAATAFVLWCCFLFQQSFSHGWQMLSRFRNVEIESFLARQNWNWIRDWERSALRRNTSLQPLATSAHNRVTSSSTLQLLTTSTHNCAIHRRPLVATASGSSATSISCTSESVREQAELPPQRLACNYLNSMD